jgi:hypothetical protein
MPFPGIMERIRDKVPIAEPFSVNTGTAVDTVIGQTAIPKEIDFSQVGLCGQRIHAPVCFLVLHPEGLMIEVAEHAISIILPEIPYLVLQKLRLEVPIDIREYGKLRCARTIGAVVPDSPVHPLPGRRQKLENLGRSVPFPIEESAVEQQ